MRVRLLTILVLGVALVAMPAVALGADARHRSNTQTYPDSIGEDPNAPDITNVVVSNDDAGLVTFQVNISNRPALTQDMFLLIFLDTDQNSATGDPQAYGADYLIELDPGSVGLLQWNGADYANASSQTSLTYAYATTGATIHVSAADLGKTKAFKFGVIAFSGYAVDASGNPDLTNLKRDAAPDFGHGVFSYQVLTRLVLTVTALTTAPKPARAGRPFTASLAANENDTAGPVPAGTVGCAASIAGKRLVVVTRAVRNGIAVCVWRIPGRTRGRIVRGLITLTVRGTSVTRGFSTRIT
jgi:hypothetical protein